MADAIIMRDQAQYSGLIYDKGNTKRPFLSLISGKRRVTNSNEFVCGQYYTTPTTNSQPAISEEASLTAPDATKVTRTQMKNVTQIFQKSLYISYAKMSNMGLLSGVNIEGQVGAPNDELEFQTAVKMDEIGNEMEYSFVNGTYQEAATTATAGKTRGIIAAITTNAITKVGTPALRYWDIVELAKTIDANGGDASNLVILCNSVNYLQLLVSCKDNGLTVIPASRNVNGINITDIVTPYGTYGIVTDSYVPAGTVVMANTSVVEIVEQPTPGKGNFFREELAKTGAGTKYHIFGQAGLDHGPEWYHGKITGLATTWAAPANDFASVNSLTV